MAEFEKSHTGRRWLILLLVVVAAGLAAYFYFRRDTSDGSARYKTETVGRGNVTMTVSATGTASAVTTVQVGSQVSGIVARLNADFNSHVKKGELLAELDPTSFAQQVEQRRADVIKSQVEVTNAEITYKRQKRLFDNGLIAQADLDGAKATYDGAKAQLAISNAALSQAKTSLGYTKIFSPIDGVVVARQYDIGQTVAASFQAPTLFTIAQDLTKMQVQADIDQSDIGRVRVGQAARFTVDAYPEQEFRGAIAQVRLNATVSQNVITYPVIIEVANPDAKLRPSMTANVTIEVDTVRDVLRVPNAALRFKPPASKADTKPTASAAAGAPPTATTAGGAERGSRSERSERGERPAGSTGRGSFEGAAAAAGDPARGGLGAGLGGGGRKRAGQTVYVLGDKNTLKPVTIRTGLSDGRYTQVISGELKEGDPIVLGLATVKVEQQGNVPADGGRPPRMGRF